MSSATPSHLLAPEKATIQAGGWHWVGMCGVTSHNVTHDVTGRVVAPKASRDGACERLGPTHTTLLDFGGNGCPG